MIDRMEVSESSTSPAPPNVITSLRTGFDAIANQIALILFPIILDLWLWFGPHLQVKQLLTDFIAMLELPPTLDAAQSSNLLPSTTELLKSVVERINLMTILRAYPIGIPSLMVGRLPVEIPSGQPLVLDIQSPWVVVAFWIVFTLVGLCAATIYFQLVSQAALSGRVYWQQVVSAWPWAFRQVLGLTILITVFLLVLGIPSSCFLSLLALSGLPLGEFGLLIYLGFVIWLLFPLFFSPHGIFIDRQNLIVSMQKSVRLVRLTLPTTVLLVVVVFLISAGLDILWRVPAETSWLALIGITGHAFVATGLLATTFVYYRDADRWVQNMWKKMKASA
jgi:hypothetical protein